MYKCNSSVFLLTVLIASIVDDAGKQFILNVFIVPKINHETFELLLTKICHLLHKILWSHTEGFTGKFYDNQKKWPYIIFTTDFISTYNKNDNDV